MGIGISFAVGNFMLKSDYDPDLVGSAYMPLAMYDKDGNELFALDVFKCTAGLSDDLRKAEDTEVTGIALTQTYLDSGFPTITIPAKYDDASDYRIKYDFKRATGAGTQYFKLYKNGAALGTEQSCTSNTYATKSQDISNLISAGDVLSIWVKRTATVGTAAIENFRVYCVDTEIVATADTKLTW